MNRLTSLQLLALLLLSSVWELLCLRNIPGSGLLTGILSAYLLQFLLLAPLLKNNGSILRQSWVSLLYAGFFILAGARNLCQLQSCAPQPLLTVPGRFPGMVLLLLTCLCTSVAGIKAAARCAPFTLGLLALSGIVLVIGAWGRTVPERFYWERSGFSEGASFFFFGTELPAFWVLLGRLHGSPRKTLLRLTLLRCTIASVLLYLCIAAGGRLRNAANAPFFTLTALSQPLQGQRADALYILVFVMLCVMQITLQTGVCAHLLEERFGIRRHTAPAVLLGMLLLAGVMSVQMLDAVTGILMPVLAFGLPCAVLMIRQLRKQVMA